MHGPIEGQKQADDRKMTDVPSVLSMHGPIEGFKDASAETFKPLPSVLSMHGPIEGAGECWIMPLIPRHPC